MSLGVYVDGEDPRLAEDVMLAIERDDALYVAAAAEHAHVLLVSPSRVPDRRGDAAIVVLAGEEDRVVVARAALRAGADGIVCWPEDDGWLAARVADAAAARAGATANGAVVSIVGVRGGAGATTVAAHLARSGDLIVDAAGGAHGQSLLATAEPPVSLRALVAGPTPRALRDAAGEHASGARCLYGGGEPTEAFVACARAVAPLVVVDGIAPNADVVVHVLGADVGSVRAAAALQPRYVVLNGARRGEVGAREVRRALGVEPLAVVPYDARLRRAFDAGRVATRGAGARSLERLAHRIRDLEDLRREPLAGS